MNETPATRVPEDEGASHVGASHCNSHWGSGHVGFTHCQPHTGASHKMVPSPHSVGGGSHCTSHAGHSDDSHWGVGEQRMRQSGTTAPQTKLEALTI